MKLLHGDNWAPYLQKEIQQARDALRISMFLFSHNWRRARPGGANLLQACIDAGKRGLDCRAILANVQHRHTNAVPNLKAAELLAEAGWHIRWIGPNVMLHEKLIIIDRLLVVIGSHNVSQAAAGRNLECSIALNDPAIARETRQLWWSRWHRALDSAPVADEKPRHGSIRPSINPALSGGAILAAARRKKNSGKRPPRHRPEPRRSNR